MRNIKIDAKFVLFLAKVRVFSVRRAGFHGVFCQLVGKGFKTGLSIFSFFVISFDISLLKFLFKGGYS